MSHLDPTYLRYIYDNLIKGSVHPDNTSELPDGLIGLYEEAFAEHIPVLQRQQLLQRFTLFALLKKEVSAAFVAEVLGESENDILEFINTYASWFNSPEPGKFQLYHERLKVYLLQKLSEGEIHSLHKKLIGRLEQAIEEQKADEFEWYGLEFLAGHLLVEAFADEEKGDASMRFSLSEKIWDRQIELSNKYDWSYSNINNILKWTYKFNQEDVIRINLLKIKLFNKEKEDLESILRLISEGLIELAIERFDAVNYFSEFKEKNSLIFSIIVIIHVSETPSLNIKEKKEILKKILYYLEVSLIATFDLIDAEGEIYPHEVIIDSLGRCFNLDLDISFFIHNTTNLSINKLIDSPFLKYRKYVIELLQKKVFEDKFTIYHSGYESYVKWGYFEIFNDNYRSFKNLFDIINSSDDFKSDYIRDSFIETVILKTFQKLESTEIIELVSEISDYRRKDDLLSELILKEAIIFKDKFILLEKIKNHDTVVKTSILFCDRIEIENQRIKIIHHNYLVNLVIELKSLINKDDILLSIYKRIDDKHKSLIFHNLSNKESKIECLILKLDYKQTKQEIKKIHLEILELISNEHNIQRLSFLIKLIDFTKKQNEANLTFLYKIILQELNLIDLQNEWIYTSLLKKLAISIQFTKLENYTENIIERISSIEDRNHLICILISKNHQRNDFKKIIKNSQYIIRNFSNEKKTQYELSSFRYEIAIKFLDNHEVQKAIKIAPQNYWYKRAFDKDYSIFLFKNGEIDNSLNVIKYLKKDHIYEYYEHLIVLSNLSTKIEQKEIGKKLIRQVEKYLNSFDKMSKDISILHEISKIQKAVSLFYFVNNKEKKALKFISNISYGFWKCSAKIEIAQHLFLMNRINEAHKMIELLFEDLELITDADYLRILKKEIRITELLTSWTNINQKNDFNNFNDSEILIGLGKKFFQYFSKNDFHNFICSKFSLDQQRFLVQGYYYSHLLIGFTNSELLFILKKFDDSTHLIKQFISSYFIYNYFLKNKNLGVKDDDFIQTLNLQWVASHKVCKAESYSEIFEPSKAQKNFGNNFLVT